MGESLNCQRCHQPLIRDSSVASLSQSQYNLLAGQLSAQQQTPSSLPPSAKLANLPPASRPAAAAWAAANPGAIAESYVFLPDIPPSPAQRSVSSTSASTSRPSSPARVASRRGTAASPPASPVPPAPPAAPGALAAKLDALLSSRTTIDHPLCVECTTLFQAQLQREFDELTRERDAYIAFEKGLRKRGNMMEEMTSESSSTEEPLVGGADEWDALLQRRKELEEEEKKLCAQLKNREAELAAVKEDEARVKEEEIEVTRQEEEFLTQNAALAGQLAHLGRTLSSAKTQLLLSSDLLQHLESKNVYNDAFQIGHAPLLDPGATATPGVAVKSSVTVGTINGLRLGGRPTVDWDEINAAWGLVALCIDRLAAKVGCTFDQYKIVPLGSFSRIEDVGKGMYELYASSDITPGRLLQNRRFSQALVALLDCLRQLVEYGRKTGRPWGQTGIEIVKDKINGHSIRLPGITSGMSLGSMSLIGLGGAEPDAKAPQGNPDEQWTRACRSVLGVLKRILVVESEADRGT